VGGGCSLQVGSHRRSVQKMSMCLLSTESYTRVQFFIPGRHIVSYSTSYLFLLIHFISNQQHAGTNDALVLWPGLESHQRPCMSCGMVPVW